MSETDPKLDEVLTELTRREPIFHRLELGTTRADFEQLTDPNFWETGASGRCYSREHIWSVLEQRYAASSDVENVWRISDFAARELAPSTYLVTYELTQNTRLTRRMTIWQKQGGPWRALYHQGTEISALELDGRTPQELGETPLNSR